MHKNKNHSDFTSLNWKLQTDYPFSEMPGTRSTPHLNFGIRAQASPFEHTNSGSLKYKMLQSLKQYEEFQILDFQICDFQPVLVIALISFLWTVRQTYFFNRNQLTMQLSTMKMCDTSGHLCAWWHSYNAIAFCPRTSSICNYLCTKNL